MWPYLLKWVTLILSVTFRYLYHSTEHTIEFSLILKWCKHYQYQFTGIVIIIIRSCKSTSGHWYCYYNNLKSQPPQHLILKNWYAKFLSQCFSSKWVHVINIFVQKGANVWHKKDGAIWFYYYYYYFAENPKSQKKRYIKKNGSSLGK